jgi:hypothetical protein
MNMRRSRCSIRDPRRDARRRSEYRSLGLFCSQRAADDAREWRALRRSEPTRCVMRAVAPIRIRNDARKYASLIGASRRCPACHYSF